MSYLASAKISPLLARLKDERASRMSGGIYHKVQVELTYNSNHMEGSQLTHDQTRLIFETATVGAEGVALRVDDVIEAANHFRCVDYIIDHALEPLSEPLFKELHRMLKSSTSDADKDWFAMGDYKRLPNEVGGRSTTPPEDVSREMQRVIATYETVPAHSLDDVIAFHVAFERIHPFQDGNGRVGRLIMFKECLRHTITPFVISDDTKLFYYRGLARWDGEKGWLRDTCLSAQDTFKEWLDYFRIPYTD
jgi:Fic family protein